MNQVSAKSQQYSAILFFSRLYTTIKLDKYEKNLLKYSVNNEEKNSIAFYRKM